MQIERKMRCHLSLIEIKKDDSIRNGVGKLYQWGSMN